MKEVYPVIITPDGNGFFVVYSPDFDINTEGSTLADALDMARDAIAMTGCYRQDTGADLPGVTSLSPAHDPQQICALIDVDFDAYRKANENRVVRRNVTLPSWLNVEADKAGLNVSKVLQDALKDRLGLV